MQHRLGSAAGIEDPRAIQKAPAILAVGHRHDQVPTSRRRRVRQGDKQRVVDEGDAGHGLHIQRDGLPARCHGTGVSTERPMVNKRN